MSNENETRSVIECNEPDTFAVSEQIGSEYAEAVAPERTSGNSWLSKLMANRKKILIPGAAVLILIILVPILISVLSNTYKTPVKNMEKIANTKSYSASMSRTIKSLNGVGQDEVEAIFEIMLDSEYYEEELDWLEEFYLDMIEDYEDAYGRDYKIKYKIDEKERLDKDSLKSFRREMKEIGSNLVKKAEYTSDYDSDDWEDAADEAGLSKSQAKKLVSLLEQLGKDWKNVTVTDGYELSVIVTITGDELDEPEESDITIFVYKVNGRWVSGDFANILSNLLDF